jgi:hypothetical protein
VIAAAATAAVVGIAIPGARIAQWRATVSIDSPTTHRAEIDEVIRALADQPHGRKQARRGTENHWFNQLPYVEARIPALFQMGGGGLQASPNYDFLWNVGDPARTAWVYDAPYVTFTRDNAASMPDGETVIETEHFAVRRLPAPGLVSPVEVRGTLPAGRFAARTRAIEWLKSADALADRLMAYAGSAGLAAPPHGRILDARRQPSPGDAADIVARVAADAPTTFVARESWHPRWRGFVDGSEVKVRRVTPDFVAVDVPAGEHVLELRFDRPWWVWATWLWLAGAVVIAWAIGRRHRGSTDSFESAAAME